MTAKPIDMSVGYEWLGLCLMPTTTAFRLHLPPHTQCLELVKIYRVGQGMGGKAQPVTAGRPTSPGPTSMVFPNMRTIERQSTAQVRQLLVELGTWRCSLVLECARMGMGGRVNVCVLSRSLILALRSTLYSEPTTYQHFKQAKHDPKHPCLPCT